MSTIALGGQVRFGTARRAPAASAPRLRLTTRGRRVLLTLAAVPLLAAAAWFGLDSGVATATLSAADSTVSYSTITVHAGDTLWGIAESIAPFADPRDVIIDLMRFNGLHSADVPSGFALAIPPQYAR